MKGKNSKTIILIGLLIVIIVSGIYIFTTMGKKDTKIADQEVAETRNINEPFYFSEEFLGEEFHDFSCQEFLATYKSEPVKITHDSSDDEYYLMNMNTKEYMYKIPDIDMILNSSYCVDEEGVFWSVDYDKEVKKVIVKSYDDEGREAKKIQLDDFKGNIFDGGYIQVYRFRVDKDFVYISSSTEDNPVLQIYTKNGNLKNVYEGIGDFDIDNKGKFFIAVLSGPKYDYDFYGFLKIDAASGSEIYRMDTDTAIDFIRYNPAENLLYCINTMKTKEIKTYDAEKGSYIKTVFNFIKDSSYSVENTYINDFLADDEGNLHLSFTIRDEEEYIHYFYNYEKIMGEEEKRPITLTVTAPYRDDFIQEAIIKYEKKYPDEKIEYDYTYSEKSSYNEHYEIYAPRFVLDLIAGEVGDVIFGERSLIKYKDTARTDAFMDLKEFLEEDPSYHQLNKEVLNGLKISEAIRAIPLNVNYLFVEVNMDLASQLGLDIDFDNMTWREALALLRIIEEKVPNTYLFSDSDGRFNWEKFLGKIILKSVIPDLVDFEKRKADLNQEWFMELLKTVKECQKSQNFITPNREFDLIDNLQGALFYVDGTDSNYGDLLVNFCKHNKDHKSMYIPIFKGEINNNRGWGSGLMVLINNRSGRKESAQKFISFLLTEEINGLSTNNRVSINESSFDIIADKSMKKHRISKDYDPEGFQNAQRLNGYIKDISHKVDYFYDVDDLVSDIAGPLQEYTEDKITLEEAISKAQSNVMISLEE